jgi:DNA-binding MarR family transcriptional regulator/GNAT superfamily N-acetyltransferase
VDEVATLRQFNRSYTQRIGVLAESYLDTGRPLGPSRLLFEIGGDGAGVADLRRRLGLDSGYLSRLLRQLEQEGLITVARDPADGRQRVVRLSVKGRREWRRLDQRADQMARRLVDPLSSRQRAALAAALAAADRLLRAATVAFDVVDPESDEAQLTMVQYFAELDARFRNGFDPGRGGAGHDADLLRAPAGAFIVMRSDQSAIGCGGVQRIDATTGEIKRMWIHPDWRGLGLGGRLLARLEGAAGELGRARVVLDTNESLDEAISMYQRAGYQSIERYNDNPYAHHWFAKDLSPLASR